jgi:hypothetical protein
VHQEDVLVDQCVNDDGVDSKVMRWMDEVCGASGGCPGRSMVVRLCTEMP